MQIYLVEGLKTFIHFFAKGNSYMIKARLQLYIKPLTTSKIDIYTQLVLIAISSSILKTNVHVICEIPGKCRFIRVSNTRWINHCEILQLECKCQSFMID